MATCAECALYFQVPESEDDFEKGKGDCVTEHKDQKGKYWLSKPVFETSETCKAFRKRS
ncbi:MAG: benzylsuccinate synthase gamma subunit family protein [Deltaproteobacteria bacterium]|nr:benzylsuccinate synthase gamma subunit family protein [Deltaproteobacteria bacterium]